MPSSRQRKQPTSPTVGGRKLRDIREAAGKSLLELASTLQVIFGEHIDTGHINKIETGRIKNPSAHTLTAILDALHTSYRERRDVLDAFGYTAPTSLPTPQEIEEVRVLTAHELEDATYPVYLMDVAHRLWAWNRYVPRLIGRSPDDPMLSRFLGVTIFDIAFNPVYGAAGLLANPAEYLPAMVQFIKSGIEHFRAEPWYADLVEKSRALPGFSAIWDQVPGDPVERFANRSIVPLKVNVPGVGQLQFRLSAAEFLLDPRFYIVHYTPHGAATMRQCAIWAEEEGIL